MTLTLPRFIFTACEGFGIVALARPPEDPGRVVGLVYVAAFALEEGESSIETARGFPATAFAPALRPAEFRAADGVAAIELDLKDDAFRRVFAADVAAPAAAVMAAAQRPVAAAALDEKAGAAAWRAMPSWYLVSTADQSIHPDAQRFMAKRAGAQIVEVDASHAVAISQPAAVAQLILTAAGVSRSPGEMLLRPPAELLSAGISARPRSVSASPDPQPADERAALAAEGRLPAVLPVRPPAPPHRGPTIRRLTRW